MKSRHSTKFFVFALVAMTLSACTNGNNPQNRRFYQNGGYVNPTYNGQGQIYTVNGVTCNAGDLNPNNYDSPANPHSQCYNPTVAQQQANVNPTYGPSVINPNYVNPNAPVVNTQAPYYGVAGVTQDISNDGSHLIRGPLHFVLVPGAAAEEDVSDNCHIGDIRDLKSGAVDERDMNFHTARFLTPQHNDRFDLFFDAQGNLSVSAQSAVGQVSTSGYIPYDLDESSQSIRIPAFNMEGPVNPQFTQSEKYLSYLIRLSEDREIRQDLDIKGNIPSGFERDSGGGNGYGSHGFSLGGGNSANAQTNTFVNTYSAQNLGGAVSNSPNRVTLTVDGLEAVIATYPTQPQHITGFFAQEFSFDSKTYVDSSYLRCEGTGHGRYVHMYLKPGK